MRTWIFGPAVSLGLIGCLGGPRDGAGVPVSRTTDLCPSVVGMEAIAWDYYNGVFVVDQGLPPPIPVGNVYSHSAFPLLGFTYPQGWTPFEYNTYDQKGVDVVRDDGQGIWRSMFVTFQNVPAAIDVRDFELQLAADFFGVTQWEEVCRNEGSGELSPGSGLFAFYDNVLVRGNGQSLLIATTVTPFPGFYNGGANIRVMSAPTDEFPDRLYDTFLAIDWQLLVGDPDGGIVSDRDGDGWIDELDAAPDDPNKH